MMIANVEKGYDFYLSIYLFIFCSVFVFVFRHFGLLLLFIYKLHGTVN